MIYLCLIEINLSLDQLFSVMIWSFESFYLYNQSLGLNGHSLVAQIPYFFLRNVGACVTDPVYFFSSPDKDPFFNKTETNTGRWTRPFLRIRIRAGQARISILIKLYLLPYTSLFSSLISDYKEELKCTKDCYTCDHIAQ